MTKYLVFRKWTPGNDTPQNGGEWEALDTVDAHGPVSAIKAVAEEGGTYAACPDSNWNELEVVVETKRHVTTKKNGE